MTDITALMASKNASRVFAGKGNYRHVVPTFLDTKSKVPVAHLEHVDIG
jgi:hypothetical protein